jgi:hypothetical protein
MACQLSESGHGLRPGTVICPYSSLLATPDLIGVARHIGLREVSQTLRSRRDAAAHPETVASLALAAVPASSIQRADAAGTTRCRGGAQRGEVRTAILLLLSDEPMHGYQIMQSMSDRSGGAWDASPGAIYPTIAQLEDEGLGTTREEGGRRLVTLTSEGRANLEERSARLG